MGKPTTKGYAREQDILKNGKLSPISCTQCIISNKKYDNKKADNPEEPTFCLYLPKYKKCAGCCHKNNYCLQPPDLEEAAKYQHFVEKYYSDRDEQNSKAMISAAVKLWKHNLSLTHEQQAKGSTPVLHQMTKLWTQLANAPDSEGLVEGESNDEDLDRADGDFRHAIQELGEQNSSLHPLPFGNIPLESTAPVDDPVRSDNDKTNLSHRLADEISNISKNIQVLAKNQEIMAAKQNAIAEVLLQVAPILETIRREAIFEVEDQFDEIEKDLVLGVNSRTMHRHVLHLYRQNGIFKEMVSDFISYYMPMSKEIISMKIGLESAWELYRYLSGFEKLPALFGNPPEEDEVWCMGDFMKRCGGPLKNSFLMHSPELQRTNNLNRTVEASKAMDLFAERIKTRYEAAKSTSILRPRGGPGAANTTAQNPVERSAQTRLAHGGNDQIANFGGESAEPLSQAVAKAPSKVSLANQRLYSQFRNKAKALSRNSTSELTSREQAAPFEDTAADSELRPSGKDISSQQSLAARPAIADIELTPIGPTAIIQPLQPSVEPTMSSFSRDRTAFSTVASDQGEQHIQFTNPFPLRTSSTHPRLLPVESTDSTQEHLAPIFPPTQVEGAARDMATVRTPVPLARSPFVRQLAASDNGSRELSQESQPAQDASQQARTRRQEVMRKYQLLAEKQHAEKRPDNKSAGSFDDNV